MLLNRSDLTADNRSDERPCHARRSSSSLSNSSSPSTSYRSSSSASSSPHGGDGYRQRCSRELDGKSAEAQRVEAADRWQASIPQCFGCRKEIADHYYYAIQDQHWHESCAVCSICSIDLTEVCFLHDGLLLCRRDYDRLYAIRCATCNQPMRSHELCMRARPPAGEQFGTSVIFHVPCFTCIVCKSPLAAGDAYVIDPASGRPICRADYTKSRRDDLSSPDDAEQTPSQHQTGCAVTATSSRRMRTSLTDDQRVFLQDAYDRDSRPNKNAREGLAKDLAVPVRVVQVWFQNQRARDKRAAASRQPSTGPDDQRTPGEVANWNGSCTAALSPGSTKTSDENDSGHEGAF